VGESTESDDALEFTVMGLGDMRPAAFFEKLVKDSPLTPNLRNARIVQRKGCGCCNYLSLSKPYHGNVLAIGDSAAHIEVINQGAMMCGYHAGHAVADELDGRNGFEAYAKWWNGAFEFNCEDPMEQLKLYSPSASSGPWRTMKSIISSPCWRMKNIAGTSTSMRFPKISGRTS